MTISEWLRGRLLDAAGVDDRPIGDKVQSLDQIRDYQWSDEFEALRRPRMVMGYFRYGPMSRQGRHDNIGSALQRLRLYRHGGNGEHLVDVANICMVEFVQQNHPNYHFDAVDDGVHAAKVDRHEDN